jgi:hypothetical protein
LLKKVKKNSTGALHVAISLSELRAEDILSGAWMWKWEEKYATAASENDIAPPTSHKNSIQEI